MDTYVTTIVLDENMKPIMILKKLSQPFGLTSRNKENAKKNLHSRRGSNPQPPDIEIEV